MTLDRYQPDPDRNPAPPVLGSLGEGFAEPYTDREQGRYRPGKRVVTAVNTALCTGQPLLVTGEPGVGKTALAASVADHLGLRLYVYVVRSEAKASDSLYHFDHLRRLYDVQNNDADAKDPTNYRTFAELGTALQDDKALILVDEIDKAPKDFPNDLLWAVEKGVFAIPETRERITAAHRPVILVTSNEERELPPPFLRRCVYLRIPSPNAKELCAIVSTRLGLPPEAPLVTGSVKAFTALRKAHEGQWQKAPSTSELLAWVRRLVNAGVDPSAVQAESPDWSALYPEALLKTRDDWERIAGPA